MDETGTNFNKLWKSGAALGFVLLMSWPLYAKDFMTTGFPSSGSSWFFNTLRSIRHDINHNGEFFNFLGTGGPGATDEKAKRIFSSFLKEAFNQAMEKWKKSGQTVTKEIHGYMKLPFYQKEFDIVCLYRHRKYTFPSGASKGDSWILPIYNGFVANDYENPILQKIKNYLVQNTKKALEKEVAIHIVAWYITFKHAQRYGFPIMEYEQLMRLNKQPLSNYLKERLPDAIYSEQFVNALLASRRSRGQFFLDTGKWQWIKYAFNYYILGRDWIDMREQKYNELGVEPFCQKLLAYMKTLDKDFKYWDFLA